MKKFKEVEDILPFCVKQEGKSPEWGAFINKLEAITGHSLEGIEFDYYGIYDYCDPFSNDPEYFGNNIIPLSQVEEYLYAEEAVKPSGFEVNILPKGTEISIESAKIVYTQQDGTNMNNMQHLEISTNDLGAGVFFEMKTKKWSFDSVGELMEIVQDFKQKLNLKENV